MTIRPISFALENWLEGATIKWNLPFEPDLDNQQDATWYQGLNCVATVSYKEVSVDIYADGDMKVWYKEKETMMRSPEDFIDAGISNDQQLRELNDQDKLDWHMNNWFDLYVEGEHLDCVEHTIGEAIMSASTYVRDESKNIETLENLTI